MIESFSSRGALDIFSTRANAYTHGRPSMISIPVDLGFQRIHS
jgi:hypothetical protein